MKIYQILSLYVCLVAATTYAIDDGKDGRDTLRSKYADFIADWDGMNGEQLFWNTVEMPVLPDEPEISTDEGDDDVGPPGLIQLYAQQGNGKMSSQMGSYDSGSCEMVGVTVDSTGYDGYVPVAISEEKFFGGISCGMCLEINFNQKTYIGLVKDHCLHCKPQAGTQRSMNVGLKLSSGYHGMKWKSIPCPTSDESSAVLQYRFTQTGTSWNQIQIINNQYPVAYIKYKRGDMWIKSTHTGVSALFKMRWFRPQGSVQVVDIKGNVFNVKTQGVSMKFKDFASDE